LSKAVIIKLNIFRVKTKSKWYQLLECSR